jgi:large subunit ribosomal protein L9
MQIILLEKIANVGNLGDVVKVKDGYARNFLIPHGKAKRATPDNLKAIEARRADLEKAAAEKLTAAEALAEKLEGATLRISQKSGVDGRLFGSVTNVDIVDALKKQGTDVEKAMVRMPSGPLKQVGDHPVTVALHTDVTAHITVHVVGETVGT